MMDEFQSVCAAAVANTFEDAVERFSPRLTYPSRRSLRGGLLGERRPAVPGCPGGTHD